MFSTNEIYLNHLNVMMEPINLLLTDFDQMSIYDICFKLSQSCLIAVSLGYSVLQRLLKDLNSLKAIWGLNHLDLSSYNKILPDITHFYAYFDNFGAFWSFESLSKAHEGPQSTLNQFLYFTCVVLVVIYPFYAMWDLKHLNCVGYNKI